MEPLPGQNKSTTRIPEAMFMQFQPMRAGGGKWSADKLGEWVAEDEIVPGGSQHLSAPPDPIGPR